MLSMALCFLLLFTGLTSAHSHGSGSDSHDAYGTELHKHGSGSGSGSDSHDAFGNELDFHEFIHSRNCVMTAWKCTSCDKEHGIIMCSRKIVSHPKFHGKPCGPTSEKRFCRVDCKMTRWGPFTPCSKKCGTGFMSRKRHIHLHARNGGKKCDKTFDWKKCNKHPCKVGCKQGEWECQDCNKYTGKKACSRKTLIYPKHGGEKCGASSVVKTCKVDCEMSDFGKWSTCSKKCGGGWKKQSRTIRYAAKYGGEPCKAKVKQAKCNTYPCSVNCKQTEWQCHGCDKYTGKKLCTRRIIVTPKYKGIPCGKNIEYKYCKVDCEMHRWKKWTACSKKCGGGYKTRSRTILHKAKYGGRKCSTYKHEERLGCNKHYCPIPCKQGKWQWGSCNYKTGIAIGSRITLVAPKYGGKKCESSQKEKDCVVDCHVTKWTPWSYCTKKCGGGFKWRTRAVKYYPRNGGAKCKPLKHMVPCNMQPCNQNCEQSEWKCGPCNHYRGKKKCTRKVLVMPKHHGKKCGPNEKTKTCQVNCKLTGWGKYSPCNKKCGGGVQESTRRIVYGAKYGGKQCGSLKHIRQCNMKKCTQDCKQSPWQCGICHYKTGKMHCTRTTLVHPVGHGEPCGILKKEKECRVDCRVSGWGKWGSCSKYCGSGYKVRQRKIITYPLNGGAACDGLEESKKCNIHECKKDCRQIASCSSCDLYSGKRQCTRKIIARPKGKGKKCKPYTFQKMCKVDCKLTPYGPFSPCSKTCGGGIKTRKRSIGHIARNGGLDCDKKLIDVRKCNTQKCVGKLVCDQCPPVYCAKKGMVKKFPHGVPCGCPYCEKPWINSVSLSVAGFAVGGLALVIGVMKRRRQDYEYERLSASVDAETEAV